jgi:phosphonate transport system substrate-binding protein
LTAYLRLGLAALALVIFATACLGGDTSSSDPLVLAFKVTDDRSAFVEDNSAFADWLAEHMGTPVEVLTVQDDRAQITALATGTADAAYMSGGPSWVAWSTFGLEAIVAETLDDGLTSYVAGLWTLSDSGIQTIEDLRGRASCHTGEVAGTGMLVPMGYLIREGYIETGDLDIDDLSGLTQARERFFSASKIGGGYLGALQCLSIGEGEVATGRSTAWDDFCSGDDPQPWCLPREAYRWIPVAGGVDTALEDTGGLARVPSHPVMVSHDLDPERRELLRDALLALNDTADGRTLLLEVLGARGLVEVDTSDHLGPYGEVVSYVPGLETAVLGDDG